MNQYRFFSVLALALVSAPFAVSSAEADTLTIHIIRSPTGMNWRSPATLARSTLENGITGAVAKTEHTIGHTFVELQCSGKADFHTLVGQTSPPEEDDSDYVFKQGYGLGMMLYRVEGVLDTPEYLTAEVAKFAKTTPRMADFRIKISNATCERLVDYYREYQARGYEKTYAGLDADPLKGEGSGCAAFSWSFLRVGGLVLPQLETAWRRKLGIPLKWVGGPTTGRKVSIFSIALTHDSWLGYGDGTLTSTAKPIDFMDLDLAVSWIQAQNIALSRPGSKPPIAGMKPFKNGKTLGLEIDLSDRPTPSGPIFLVP